MRLWYHHILSCSLQVNDLPATCWCGWCVAQSYSEIEKKKVSGVYYLCTSSRLVYVNAGTHVFPSFPFFSSPLYSILCVSLTLLPCVLTEHWAVEGVVLYTLLWWPKNYCFHYPFCVSDLSLIEEFPFLRQTVFSWAYLCGELGWSYTNTNTSLMQVKFVAENSNLHFSRSR